MPFELVNTSAPKGIDPGSKGFTTVAITQGLGGIWRTRLESMSSYSLEDSITSTPSIYMHLGLHISGSTRSVLSRIAPSGLDYSGRPNRIAHHFLLDKHEQVSCGPASLLQQPNFFYATWDKGPEILQAKQLQDQQNDSSKCSYWEKVTGDAGNAGHLLRQLFSNSKRPLYIVADEDIDCLLLFSEAISLLDPSNRWNATFTTLLQNLPSDATCSWQVVIAGTRAAKNILGRPDSDKLILSALPSLPDDQYTDAARSGTPISASGASSKKMVVPELPQQPLEPEDDLQLDLTPSATPAPTPTPTPTQTPTPALSPTLSPTPKLIKDKQSPLPWIIAGIAAVLCIVLLLLLITSKNDGVSEKSSPQQEPPEVTTVEPAKGTTDEPTKNPKPPNATKSPVASVDKEELKAATEKKPIEDEDAAEKKRIEDEERLAAVTTFDKPENVIVKLDNKSSQTKKPESCFVGETVTLATTDLLWKRIENPKNAKITITPPENESIFLNGTHKQHTFTMPGMYSIVLEYFVKGKSQPLTTTPTQLMVKDRPEELENLPTIDYQIPHIRHWKGQDSDPSEPNATYALIATDSNSVTFVGWYFNREHMKWVNPISMNDNDIGYMVFDDDSDNELPIEIYFNQSTAFFIIEENGKTNSWRTLLSENLKSRDEEFASKNKSAQDNSKDIVFQNGLTEPYNENNKNEGNLKLKYNLKDLFSDEDTNIPFTPGHDFIKFTSEETKHKWNFETPNSISRIAHGNNSISDSIRWEIIIDQDSITKIPKVILYDQYGRASCYLVIPPSTGENE